MVNWPAFRNRNTFKLVTLVFLKVVRPIAFDLQLYFFAFSDKLTLVIILVRISPAVLLLLYSQRNAAMILVRELLAYWLDRNTLCRTIRFELLALIRRGLASIRWNIRKGLVLTRDRTQKIDLVRIEHGYSKEESLCYTGERVCLRKDFEQMSCRKSRVPNTTG